MGVLKIPDELLQQAARVPGLRERVTRFIKLEVVQHEMRQKRFRPETLDLISRAQFVADQKRAAGVDLDEERTAFLQCLGQMTAQNSL